MENQTSTKLQEKIKQMKKVSNQFYAGAIAIQNHPFIEFCGLMNEYIKCCEEALQQGIDFTQCNTHSGRKLPMAKVSKEYINEKLECIFTGDFEVR